MRRSYVPIGYLQREVQPLNYKSYYGEGVTCLGYVTVTSVMHSDASIPRYSGRVTAHVCGNVQKLLLARLPWHKIFSCKQTRGIPQVTSQKLCSPCQQLQMPLLNIFTLEWVFQKLRFHWHKTAFVHGWNGWSSGSKHKSYNARLSKLYLHVHFCDQTYFSCTILQLRLGENATECKGIP